MKQNFRGSFCYVVLGLQLQSAFSLCVQLHGQLHLAALPVMCHASGTCPSAAPLDLEAALPENCSSTQYTSRV